MTISELKGKLGLNTNMIKTIHPQHDDDVCYIYGLPFQLFSYSELKKRGIKDEEICKCKTLKEHRKDSNYYFNNILNVNKKLNIRNNS